MTTRTRIAIILVSAPVLAFVVVGGLMARTAPRPEAYPHLRVFDDVFSLTANNYVESVDADRLMHGAMHGLAEALDADSAYLTPEEARTVMAGASLPAGDIGLVLTRQYYLRVIAAREGSPAARAGIRTGDYIRIINRQPTRDMSVWEGRALLRGEPGTSVTLTILRGNATEPHVVDVVRAAPAAPAPAASIAAPGIGLVRVPAFTDATPAALRQAVARVTTDGATRLILDLRGCAGGPAAAGLEAARLFVASGTIGQLETRGQPRQTFTAGDGDGAVSAPLAVLVDGGTSGPAELLASALAGTKRAELIGERTAGQVALQKLFPLPDGSALWMSYAYYLTTGGDPIHQRGLVPAVVVEQPDVDFGAALPPGDATVAKAVERLTGRTSS